MSRSFLQDCGYRRPQHHSAAKTKVAADSVPGNTKSRNHKETYMFETPEETKSTRKRVDGEPVIEYTV
ncbi:unnamed protein product, partial [Ceratitis capitata]